MNRHRPLTRTIQYRGEAAWTPRVQPAGMTIERRRKHNATNQAAVPRRSCRQPAAAGRAEAGARAPRQGRDRRRRAEGGRGSRDRGRHQEAGGGRPAIDHRRRIPPLLVASRLSVGARRRREARHGYRHRVCGGDDAQRRHQGHRQDRLLRPPDARAFQVSQGAHDADAEDDHSGAVGAVRPADRARRSTSRSIRTSRKCSTISARPTKRRCAPSPTPAAATCSSTRCSSPCCAIRITASR